MAGVKGRSGIKSSAQVRNGWDRPEIVDDLRARIKASWIIKRLHDHLDGKLLLEATQIRSAEILLKKVLPDLASVDLQTTGDHSITIELVQFDKETLKALPNTRPLLDVTPDTTAVDHDED